MADKFKVNALNIESRKLLTVSSFMGVDYSPAQLSVDNAHAVDILNMIFKDKVNQKRTGWEQIAKANDYVYYIQNNDGDLIEKTNSSRINGFWQFYGEDNALHTIIHIGSILFIANNIGKNFSFLDAKLTPLVENKQIGLETFNIAQELLDTKTMAFVSNKRLYILGGTKLYVIKANNGLISMTAVDEDEDTYIPTTTIGKTYKDSSVPSGTPLDDVNQMTQFRKNGLVSGTYLDDGVSLRTTRFWDWELDGSVVCKRPTDINKIKVKINELREVN